MAVWPFNRSNNDKMPNGKPVPKEVQQYYASERRERVGLAWLIAFVSLIITTAVILGLFVGGRWVYHKVHTKSTTTAVKSNSPANKNTKPQTNNRTTTKPNSSANSSNQSQSTAKPNNNPSSTTTPSASTPSTTAPSTTASPAAQNQPTASTQKITNTGPGQTIGVFLSASLLGAVVYQLYLRRKLRA